MSALIGHIAAFLSNLFFGLSIPVTKELLSSWLDPIGYTLLRALSAAVIFWTVSFFRVKKWRAAILPLSRRVRFSALSRASSSLP